MEKKIACHEPENQFPLARIRFPQQEYYLKIGFRLISIMVFTGTKKFQNPFPLSEVRFLFKNWIPLDFHQQEEGCILQNGFFLISITVSTSRKKAIKSFSVQAKYYSFIQSALLVKTIIETIRKPIFKENLHYRNCFSGL